ncbi:MAG: hypothetical protein IKS49_04590, partial [Actinomycetaceae bacterium]|nr:hypothetical protein [Actinomycetaceae bacterium]
DSGTPVVIASARDEENTAPLSIALAHSLAKADHKEVLVDTNPQAKVSHTLELTNKKGLSDILKKNTDIATSITSLNGIDVIPAGTTSEALSDLLATTAITDTINHLDTYRVICDGAGVLDSSTLMSLGEIPRTHAILVAYANQTTLSDAQQSALLLEESGFEILGTVLMDLDTSTYARLRYGNPELLEDFTRKGLASHAA